MRCAARRRVRRVRRERRAKDDPENFSTLNQNIRPVS
jgi:hypothetical protein